MKNEGHVDIDTSRFGIKGLLRKKEWWYFEGIDVKEKIYYVFLALRAFPISYVSIKIIDYKNNRRFTEEHMGSFISEPGDRVKVSASGKWGYMRFSGSAEQGWIIDVSTEKVKAQCFHIPLAPVHVNHLLTQHIDYTINQFIKNEATGTIIMDGSEYQLKGSGYHEHNWGVQPRHSTAHWLHFWGRNIAGVVLSCHYDAGVPHHYTCLWDGNNMSYLFSPAQFGFDPSQPDKPWSVKSPDIDLVITPLAGHHTRMGIPPLIEYIHIDYYEQLFELKGTAMVRGVPVNIDGIGKLDHNWNRW
ncbi:MAG TPA: DUF2804 family protein [Desulfomonilia bacterium]